MNYKEKYEQALERARYYHSKDYMLINNAIENIFPELKESEDDKIRKAIHIYLDWLDGRKDYAPKGDYTQGLEVCHICDNPCCINPEHLFIGTRQDNIDDRERKGRNVVKVVEENATSKLTKKDVENARRERFLKGTTFQALANKYGVCKHTMMNAIKGITWKCVSYMPLPAPPEHIADVSKKISSSELPNNQKGGEQ